MTHSFRLRNKVRTETIPEVVIFTDTETRERSPGSRKTSLQLVLGCYEVWTVGADGCRVKMVQSGTYWSEDEYHELVDSFCDSRIVAHNWNFDASVLKIGSREYRERYSYTINVGNGIYPVSGQGQAPFFIVLQYPDKTVEMVCNTNFRRMPLAVIGESFGFPKGTMPDETEYEDGKEYLADLETYCRRDVEILRESYFDLYDFTAEVTGTTPGFTAAMAANRVYRTRYYDPSIKAQGTLGIPYISECEREAYHGGRTDTFWKGCPGDKDIYKYDVNSLYPYMMLSLIHI